jgi:hypothetical protein
MLHELAYFKGNTYRGNSVFFTFPSIKSEKILLHDDTTADEKYQFTCMIDFSRVFRDGANV